MVLARFLPRDEQFFDHFTESAANALETAKLLAEIVEFGPDTERKVRRLRDLDTPATRSRHRIYQALNSTFVTPLDRDDIRELAGKLDDFVDEIEEAGKRLWLYQLGAADRAGAASRRASCSSRPRPRHGPFPMLEQVGKNGRRDSALRRSRSTGSKTRPTTRSTRPSPRSTTASTEVPQLIKAHALGRALRSCSKTPPTGPRTSADTLEGILLKNA